MDTDELKLKYNKKLLRMKKAINFMDGPASDEQKEKWFPEFLKLWRSIEEQLEELKRSGCEMTPTEILKGFGE
jgi:hypothetical protein